jgi:hypothetical protein
MSDEQIMKIIAEGAGKMPPSRNSAKKSKKQVNYSRSLAK